MTSTPLRTSDISIIVPTLNEENNIFPLFENVRHGGHEILIVDGGSHDKTVAYAKKCGFTVLSSTPGRGAQLNQGALAAKGNILLFLHADTRLPQGFSSTVLATLSNTKNIAGAFRLAIENATPAMRFICTCANIRSSLLQLPYGDQAIFISKKDFIRIGKYPELPIMEDYIFIRNAKKNGKIALCRERVHTSARRWIKRGIFATTLINQLVILGYYCKIPLEKLALFYRR